MLNPFTITIHVDVHGIYTYEITMKEFHMSNFIKSHDDFLSDTTPSAVIEIPINEHMLQTSDAVSLSAFVTNTFFDFYQKLTNIAIFDSSIRNTLAQQVLKHNYYLKSSTITDSISESVINSTTWNDNSFFKGHLLFTKPNVPVRKRMRSVFPGVENVVACPEPQDNECISQSVWIMIQHLNDEHKWDRNKIADWTETLDIDLTIQEEKIK